MKTVCKKLFSLLLVAVLLVSAIPFQAFATQTLKVYFSIEGTGELLQGSGKNFNTGTKFSSILPKTNAVQTEYDNLYSDGKQFQGWYFDGGAQGGKPVDVNKVMSLDMSGDGENVSIVAKFAQPQVTVTLNPNGGTVSPTTVSYTRYEGYGSKLPAPTREGYVFAGWFTNVNDESTRAQSGKEVPGNVTLVAKWEAGSLPVVFQGWDGATQDFIEMDRRNPTTGKSLSQSGLSMPEQTNDYIDKPGYSVDTTNPWVDSKGNVFTVNTVINDVTYVRPNLKANTYTITYDYNCTELSTETVKVQFDSKVNLKTPTRANYVFTGWWFNDNGTAKQLKTGDVYTYGDLTLKASWAPKGTVELRVYRDDVDGFKTYYYSGAILGDELDLNECKITNYLSGTYEFDGWYDYNGWVSYLGTKSTKGVEEASNSITRLEKVATSNTTNSTVTVIYGMVRGYKATTNSGSASNNNNYNTNDSNLDKTNPKTGDMIMVSTTVMLVSAAALVLFLAMRKKKAC